MHEAGTSGARPAPCTVCSNAGEGCRQHHPAPRSQTPSAVPAPRQRQVQTNTSSHPSPSPKHKRTLAGARTCHLRGFQAWPSPRTKESPAPTRSRRPDLAKPDRATTTPRGGPCGPPRSFQARGEEAPPPPTGGRPPTPAAPDEGRGNIAAAADRDFPGGASRRWLREEVGGGVETSGGARVALPVACGREEGV